MKKLLIALLMLALMLPCATAEEPYVFEDIQEPVLLLDDSAKDRRSASAESGVSAKITLIRAEENALYLTIENRSAMDVDVSIPRPFINGMLIDRYYEWTVPAKETQEVRMRLPERTLRWMGYTRIETLYFDSLRVTKATDIYHEDVQIHKQWLSFTLCEAAQTKPAGHALWASELGQLTLLGVDYSDCMYPRLMLRLDNYQEPVAPDWLPNYMQPQILNAKVTVLSVNDLAIDNTHDEIGIEGLGNTAQGIMLRGFELTNALEGEQNPLPVGEVQSLELQIPLSGTISDNIWSGTVTLSGDEIGPLLYGDPYRWIGKTGLTLRPEWEAYYNSLRDN